MNHKAILILLCLVTLTALTGCTDDTVSAEEIKEDNIEAIQNLDTYEFDADLTMTLETSGQDFMSQIGDFEVTSSMQGKVDQSNQRMYIMASQETMGFGFDYESYLNGSNIYLRYIDAGGLGLMGNLSNTWIKIELGEQFENTLESQQYMDNQREILSISEVSYNGETTLDGETVHKINLEPDPDEFKDLVNELTASSASNNIAPDEESNNTGFLGDTDSIEFQNISIKYWISKETSQLEKSQINLEISMTDETLGETNASLNLTINFSNHNEEMNIELPPEAQDALTLEEYLGQMMGNQSIGDRYRGADGSGGFDYSG